MEQRNWAASGVPKSPPFAMLTSAGLQDEELVLVYLGASSPIAGAFPTAGTICTGAVRVVWGKTSAKKLRGAGEQLSAGCGKPLISQLENQGQVFVSSIALQHSPEKKPQNTSVLPLTG